MKIDLSLNPTMMTRKMMMGQSKSLMKKVLTKGTTLTGMILRWLILLQTLILSMEREMKELRIMMINRMQKMKILTRKNQRRCTNCAITWVLLDSAREKLS